MPVFLLFPAANVKFATQFNRCCHFAGGGEMRVVKALSILLLSTGFFSLTAFGSAANAQSFKYCRSDVQRLCKGMMPGGGKIMKCLKAHENDLTVGCAKELKAMKAKMGK
jgi:hypothetical protein